MSSEQEKFILSGLKRGDIVKHLNTLKITPASDEFKSKYIDYLCSNSPLTESDLTKQINDDINKIKQFYKKCHFEVPAMLRNHAVFFSSVVKVKRAAPPLPTVNLPTLKSHHLTMGQKIIIGPGQKNS